MKTVIFVDTGTTNSRVWLVAENEILAHAEAMVGVRDTAREGNNNKLKAALRDLIAEVQVTHKASAVMAAGMITSALGLADIPHLSAPVGIAELAASTKAFSFPDITDLPFYLVTGVRSGSAKCTPENVAEIDLMRGEETLLLKPAIGDETRDRATRSGATANGLCIAPQCREAVSVAIGLRA